VSPPRVWDVLGVGDADVDLFLGVERLPGRDEKVMGEYLGEHPGGVVANFCCAASRLGARTALVTVVGEDRYGKMAVADLEAHDVDTSLVKVRLGGITYFCVVHLDDSGEKALTVVKTDCMLPDRSEVDPDSFTRARLVHLMASDPPFATWVARQAKTRGALVSVDLEPGGASHGFSALRELLSNADLVFPNEAGLSLLTREDPVAGAERILRLGPRVVVVTLGSKGCLIVTGDSVLRVPSFRVPVIDTTGAGDCFNGAFVTGYLRGWDFARCGEFASAAAALSVGAVGARSALPSSGEVERYLSERSADRLSRKEG
jgi:sugar/nucleoside kinase (ribokinase family)